MLCFRQGFFMLDLATHTLLVELMIEGRNPYAADALSKAEARALRRANAPSIFMAGLLPALFALVPLLNLLMPLFATSYFIHVFKRAAATSA